MNEITRCDWLPAVSRKQNFPKSHIINPLFNKVCSVKMAGYWPRSFFARLWTSTSSRSINTQKKNLANIQSSWPHTWSITHTSYTSSMHFSVHQITHRVRTLLSSSNSMTFHDFFHDVFKLSKTLGLALSFKNTKPLLVLEHFLTVKSSTQTRAFTKPHAVYAA